MQLAKQEAWIRYGYLFNFFCPCETSSSSGCKYLCVQDIDSVGSLSSSGCHPTLPDRLYKPYRKHHAISIIKLSYFIWIVHRNLFCMYLLLICTGFALISMAGIKNGKDIGHPVSSNVSISCQSDNLIFYHRIGGKTQSFNTSACFCSANGLTWNLCILVFDFMNW